MYYHLKSLHILAPVTTSLLSLSLIVETVGEHRFEPWHACLSIFLRSSLLVHRPSSTIIRFVEVPKNRLAALVFKIRVAMVLQSEVRMLPWLMGLAKMSESIPKTSAHITIIFEEAIRWQRYITKWETRRVELEM